MSKQHIRRVGGDERCDDHRVKLLNPFDGEKHKQGMYLDRWTKHKVDNKQRKSARKGRRRARPERRRKQNIRYNITRAWSRAGELNVASWSARSLSLTGTRGAGHAEVLFL